MESGFALQPLAQPGRYHAPRGGGGGGGRGRGRAFLPRYPRALVGAARRPPVPPWRRRAGSVGRRAGAGAEAEACEGEGGDL